MKRNASLETPATPLTASLLLRPRLQSAAESCASADAAGKAFRSALATSVTSRTVLIDFPNISQSPSVVASAETRTPDEVYFRREENLLD
ncbi:MAG: hypothetical protein E2P02_08000 [Acidobacteria bacterium]|nr:MAG: hypothetical protein E2P02_08000 [Acidobacteriota bacterium]